MKKYLPLCALVFACSTTLKAQDHETIVLEAGVTTIEGLHGQLHLYPQFSDAVVYFKNGNKGKGRMNVSLLNGEMLFISGSNDTLALTGEADISFITIGKDTFYMGENVFVRQQKNYGLFKTATLQRIREIERRKVGGYGETVTGAVASWSFLKISKLFVDLRPMEKIVLSKETVYFISDAANHFLPLTKNNFFKTLIPEQARLAKTYLQKQQVDFGKKDEVDTLLTWLAAQSTQQN